jgi:hypothetical protein
MHELEDEKMKTTESNETATKEPISIVSSNSKLHTNYEKDQGGSLEPSMPLDRLRQLFLLQLFKGQSRVILRLTTKINQKNQKIAAL